MFDEFRVARDSDFDAIWQFYTEVCEHMPLDAYQPHWVLGVFPAQEDIRAYLDAGQFYLGFVEGKLAAAMALADHDDSELASFDWPSKLAGKEVSAIHLLAVHPDARRERLGTALVQEAQRLSLAWGKRAIHLDVYPGNLAASRLYLAEGFSYAGVYEAAYEDIGTIAFEMYECELPTR